MDVKETNVILKYKRLCDSWVCPDCDTENNVSLGKCTVCGCRKSESATILKQWTEADERPVTPPPKKTITTPTGPIFKDETKDDYIPEEENKNKIIWGVLIGIVLFILLMIGLSQGGNASAYDNAMNEYYNGNYEMALSMFDNLPSDYKDVSYMIDESKYQLATQHFDSGDFTTAESLFESITHHSDSAEMVTSCRYQTACQMLNDGRYIDAMKAFNELGSYSDSTSLFQTAENNILSINRRNGYFAGDYSMIGHWEDSSGNYVAYERQSNGSVNANYGISCNWGEHFKITNGIHYHSTDNGGWEKQWIYYRIDATTVAVYDYIDGQTFKFTKR